LRGFWGLSVYPIEMVDSRANGCPEPEVLAAYADRGLSLSERARVEIHLASCPQCIALVAGAARTVAELSAHAPDGVVTAGATPFVTRRSLAGALAAAAAVIAVVAAPSLVRPWFERDAGLVSLVDSVGEHRSVLGRLTGGFPHAPLGAPSAGGQDGRAAETDRVLLTAGKIRESFGGRTTPSDLHALGVSQLLSGRYDEAAQALLAASREQPANAKYLNDLATAQLERARLGLRPDDLPRALAAADRARRLDPSLREAWFNRALAASALSLTDEARTAWTEYLKRDSSSDWATEARSRLEELARPTPAAAWTAIESRLQQPFDAATADEAVRTQPAEARNLIEQTLAQWAAGVVARRDASAELNRARTLADAFLRITTDALYRDTVAAIDAAGAKGGDALTALAKAHQEYATAAAIYTDDRYLESGPGLARAKAALNAAGSPFALRATLDLATVDYVRNRHADALAAVDAALETARRRHYAGTVARAHWVHGLVAFVQGRMADTQSRYEDMLAEFQRMGDREHVAVAHNLLAGFFFYLGNESEAWQHHPEALRGLGISRSPRFRHVVLSSAATSARFSNPAAALAIQEEVVRNAQQWGRAAASAEALALRASLYSDAGQASAARSDIAAARRQLASVTETGFAERVEVAVLGTESDLLRQTNPAAAVAAATRAIAILENRGDRSRLAPMELRLAKANIVWGNAREAELALAKGIKAFDDERSALSDEARLLATDASWELFDTAVQLAIQKNDLQTAFTMAERARMRSLGERQRFEATRTLQDVQASLARDEAIVALNQFDDQLAVWVIRQSATNVVTRRVSRADAQRLVARQQNEIWQESQQPTGSRDLYNEILRPAAAHLSGVKRIIVVPDATYENAAFAALWDSSTGRYLVENIALAIAPSANAYAALRGVAVRHEAVTDPLVFGGADPKAIDEARAIGAAYTSPNVVTGADATRTRFFSSANRGVIHLAVPVTSSRSNPLLSRIRVTDDPGVRHSGTILGRDIAARPLSQTRLVVVDEVERDRTDRGEGTSSIARAFMAAGVPAVLGTLPGADESAARDLMIGFHREMSKGMSAEQALSTVQRNAIQQNGRRLGAWTALVIYGSDR
jgi:tetratricopeptide (TPR) repeat protein